MPKVTSLDLSQELARVAEEHGVELPESEYYWVLNGVTKCYKLLVKGSWFPADCFSAYQTDELLEWLPNKTIIRKIVWANGEAFYEAEVMPANGEEQVADSIANALCKLAIAGIEEGWLR